MRSVKAFAPGRINIIGEHTDYNDGYVLPAAIDKNIVFKLTKNGSDNDVNITAVQKKDTYSFDLSNFKPVDGGWYNYVLGVVSELQKLSDGISGFNGEFGGDVPIGSGMSSSAALECSLAYGLNELFDLGLDKWQLIKASQKAEHNFVGTLCGIMDQFASIMGKKDHVMFLDCRTLEYKYSPFELKDHQVILLNTNVSHSLASSEYNTRREECNEGVRIMQSTFPEIMSLRDVSTSMFSQCKKSLPETIARRCQHVISENNRVLHAIEALEAGNIELLGQLIYQSHFSLQNDYDVSCPELDYLVKQTLDKNYVLGSRMMGGGFGGCTISILEKTRVDEYIDITATEYRNKFGIELTPYQVSIENGASLIN